MNTQIYQLPIANQHLIQILANKMCSISICQSKICHILCLHLKKKKEKSGGGLWRKLEKKENKKLCSVCLIIITKENELYQKNVISP